MFKLTDEAFEYILVRDYSKFVALPYLQDELREFLLQPNFRDFQEFAEVIANLSDRSLNNRGFLPIPNYDYIILCHVYENGYDEDVVRFAIVRYTMDGSEYFE